MEKSLSLGSYTRLEHHRAIVQAIMDIIEKIKGDQGLHFKAREILVCNGLDTMILITISDDTVYLNSRFEGKKQRLLQNQITKCCEG